jgi:phosphate transport system protein
MFKVLKKYLRRESLMVQAYQETEETLKTCKEMVEETIRSLRYSDTSDLKFDIREKDQQINRYQQEIRRMMLTHLAISSQTDVHTALVMTSIVIDVERIGDYAKNIEDLAIAHPKRLKAGRHEEIVRKLEDEVKSKFESVTSAFKIYDIEAAKEVMDEHRSITKQCDILVTELVGAPNTEIPANDQVALALYVRYLKRISSHLTNIVSSVVNPFDMIGFKGKNGEDKKAK